MEITNVDQNIKKMNDDKLNSEKQNCDSIFKTYDRPYIKPMGTGSRRSIYFDPITFIEFGDNYKLAVNQLMKETSRKAFARKLCKTVIKPLFEELTSVFWVTPNESQLNSMASAFSYRNIELCKHYLGLPYGSSNYEQFLKDQVFVELHSRYIRKLGKLSSIEKSNWFIKPSVNRKLSAKIRSQH